MKGELYHHGIVGMHWGDRHGPPYPLDNKVSKAIKTEGKRKGIIGVLDKVDSRTISKKPGTEAAEKAATRRELYKHVTPKQNAAATASVLALTPFYFVPGVPTTLMQAGVLKVTIDKARKSYELQTGKKFLGNAGILGNYK